MILELYIKTITTRGERMRKRTKVIIHIFQLILPILFLFYFKHYITLKEMLQRSSISVAEIFGNMLIYFLLLLIFFIFCTIQKKEPAFFITILEWVEVAAIYILPLVFPWKTELFMYIKGYPIDYLHIYGIVFFAYSIQLIHCCLIPRKKS